jgi:tRNA (cmo5U34)-methyltransferase
MQDIFNRIFDALKPGGMFINADIVKFDTDSYSQKAGEIYLEFLRESLKDERAVEAWERHIEIQDKPSSLGKIMEYLKLAGFQSMETSFRYWGFAVYSARKHPTE